MTRGLQRYHHSGQSHFITFSCYHRLPYLGEPRFCNLVLTAVEATRQRFAMYVYAYVLMPEHVHLLISEPEKGTVADAMHYLKLSSSKRLRPLWAHRTPFWQPRYYDRNVRDYDEFMEKLNYIHRNPIKRGLCASADHWPWSSYRHYTTGEASVVKLESQWTARARERAQQTTKSCGL